MVKEKYKKIASHPKMISGIHNYCDKWCERCRFITRCAVGVMELEDKKDNPEGLSLDSPEFFNKLHGIFADTFEMIREWAKKNGVDVDAPIPDEYWIQQDKIDKNAKEHICAKASLRYLDMVRKWMDDSSDDFKKKAAALMKEASLELPGTSPEMKALEIKDAVDAIIWFHTLIHVKLMRAVQQIFDDEPEELEDYPKDYDGSAKVALIGMDNSIDAWKTLLAHFPENEDDILKMLAHLQKLRTRTEQEFPGARSFKRPGFDGIE